MERLKIKLICSRWLLTLVALVALVAGCAARAKNVTNLPAGVTMTQVQNWDAAVANLQKIAATTSTLRQAVIALNKTGAFPDGPAYAATLDGIGKVDQLQIEAANFLQTVPNDWSLPTQQKVQAYVQQIQATLTDITTNGVAGIKDPASQSQISTLISNIGAAAAIIISLTT